MDLSPSSLLGKLRNDAIHNDEHATKKLWHFFLSNYVFNDPNTWVVATEQPPVDHHSLRRIDLTVEKFCKDRATLTLVMTGEGKKARASPDDIAEVESQAYTACTEHMLASENKGREWVWTMTFFGCEARIWACDISAGWLEPYYPSIHDFGDKSYYRDIKHSLDEFLTAFDYIKRHPIPTAAMFQNKDTMNYGEGSGVQAVGYAADAAGAPMDIDPGPTLTTTNVIDTEQCTFLKVKEITKLHVTGKREDGGTVNSPALENWQAARAFVPQENAYYPCFTATASSGTQYWAWTLDVETKDKRRRRKHK